MMRQDTGKFLGSLDGPVGNDVMMQYRQFTT